MGVMANLLRYHLPGDFPGGYPSMIGLLADVHANIDALETVLATLAARGVEQIYCAGDLVGYNAAPNACCERVCAT
jgi:hypothetical protein